MRINILLGFVYFSRMLFPLTKVDSVERTHNRVVPWRNTTRSGKAHDPHRSALGYALKPRCGVRGTHNTNIPSPPPSSR